MQPCVNSHWLSQWEALGTLHFLPPTESTYLNRSLKNLSGDYVYSVNRHGSKTAKIIKSITLTFR